MFLNYFVFGEKIKLLTSLSLRVVLKKGYLNK